MSLRFLHHFVVQLCSGFVPVVFALLQPPATICQPSGLMHSQLKKLQMIDGKSHLLSQSALSQARVAVHPPSAAAKLADFLSLERNVSIASAAVFLLGLGEELWKKFLPKYLEALGASTPVIGLFGTAEDFFDAIYQYPGGWIADRFGRRRAFLFFVATASAGYLVYYFAFAWPLVFVGLAFAMAWQSMASPAIFAIIGDSLPPERRAMGFTLQSILKRVPIVIAPVIGGVLIAKLGVVEGVHTGLLITLGLAAVTFLLVLKVKVEIKTSKATNIRGVWRSFHSALKRLLISDVIIRMCEGMTGVLTILYVTNIDGLSTVRYGTLIAVADGSFNSRLYSGRQDCRSHWTQAFCDRHLSEFRFVSRRRDFCQQLCVLDSRLRHRRPAGNWRAVAKGDDR